MPGTLDLVQWHAVLIIDIAHLPHPVPVLFLHKRLCRKPGLNDLHRHKSTNDLGSQAKDVRIRMLAGKRCAQGILANRCVAAVDLVRDQCTSVADTVAENASFTFSLGNS